MRPRYQSSQPSGGSVAIEVHPIGEEPKLGSVSRGKTELPPEIRLPPTTRFNLEAGAVEAVPGRIFDLRTDLRPTLKGAVAVYVERHGGT